MGFPSAFYSCLPPASKISRGPLLPVQEPIYRPGGAEREDGAGRLAPAQEEDDDGDPPEDPKVSAEAHREGVRFLPPPPLDSLEIGTGLEWKYKSFVSDRLQMQFGFGCD